MQTKRNKRYVIHYPPGACGDFLMTCLYLLDIDTPENSWKSHTFIDRKGKVWPGDKYQIEVSGFVSSEDELFPKAPNLRNTSYSVEDYIYLDSIINRNKLDINTYKDTYSSIYKHTGSEKKHLEIGGTHHLFSYNNNKEIRYMFLEWSDEIFNFDKSFYVSFDSLEESITAYCKYYIKDTGHDRIVEDLDGRELANRFKYFDNCLKTQNYLSELGMIGIPFSLLEEANHVKIAKYLSKFLDVHMSQQYINFVETYKKKNRLSHDVVQSIKAKLIDDSKLYMDNFQNIQKGMRK